MASIEENLIRSALPSILSAVAASGVRLSPENITEIVIDTCKKLAASDHETLPAIEVTAGIVSTLVEQAIGRKGTAKIRRNAIRRAAINRLRAGLADAPVEFARDDDDG